MAVNVDLNLNPNTRKVEAALARIQAQARGIDFGGGARAIDKLSRPLGKITGQASEFQKSLEASNARVLAFGASVAVINKLSQAFGALVANTIKVEATFAKINTILGGTEKQLQQFGDGIFRVAQNTATAFDQVATGALELARQGLSVEESLNRVETALKLVRVAGIDSEQAVAGLTAAIKGFEGAGLTVANIADKLAEVDTKFAVSTEDLINGLERASASARVAGVSFDELLAVVTTVQERTQRGGAVIGNAFKTIFARLGRTDTLVALEQLGIQVLDSQGNVRSAIPLFEELAVELDKLGLKSVEAGEIIQKVAGVRQRDILISLVEDLTSGQSQFASALQVSAGAAGALDAKNAKLNDTLEALINNLTVGAQKLSSVIGELGFADAAKDILKVFSAVVNGITDLLQGDSIGAKFAQGIIKGIGSILTGPGLALVSAIFVKLFVDLAKFGATSLKSLLGVNKAAEAQKTLQQSVLQTLLQNEAIQKEILALEGNKVAQEQLLLKIYNQQAAALSRVQKAAATVTPGLFGRGFRGGEGGINRRAAGGYVAAEARDVSRGVGGAPANSKVVSIPNFAFGGGKRGTMVANTSEYYVPNYAGGGDAIFNRDMIRSRGLPSGARKINAAGGYIPNFANRNVGNYGFLIPEMGANRPLKPLDVSIAGKKVTLTGARARGIQPGEAKTVSDPIENRIRKSVIDSSTKYANELQPLGRTVSRADIETGFGTIAGAKGALQAAIGSAFEVGITTALDYKAAIREKGGDFDIRGGANLPRIRKLFGMPPSMSIADLKVSDSVGNVESYYSKVMKEIGAGAFTTREKRANARSIALGQLRKKYPQFYTTKGVLKTRGISIADKKRMEDLESRTTNKVLTSRFQNAASGYIPNFAMSPLEDAIQREKEAGLPISQIRINQSGKLRNADNPLGLAVTNTRDEPTGRIPNFAKPGGDRAVDLTIGKIFALQLAIGGLTTAFTDQESVMNEVGTAAMGAVNALLVLSTVGISPFGKTAIPKGVTQSVGKTIASFGRLAKFIGPVAKGIFTVSRFIGPIGIGLFALNSALKIFTGRGILAQFGIGVKDSTDALDGFEKKLQGLTTGEIEDRRDEAERRVESLKNNKAFFQSQIDAIPTTGRDTRNSSIRFARKLTDSEKFAQEQLKGIDNQIKIAEEALRIANAAFAKTGGGIAAGEAGKGPRTAAGASEFLTDFGPLGRGRLAAQGIGTEGLTGNRKKLLEEELALAKAVGTIDKINAENRISDLKFEIDAQKQRFEITEQFTKNLKEGGNISEEALSIVQEQVEAGADLLEIQTALQEAGIVLKGDTEEVFRLDLKKLENLNLILKAKKEEIDAEKEINNLKKDTSFSAGLREGLGNLQNDIDFFKRNLGEELPDLFSSNMSQAFKDIASEAKTVEDALRSAASSFLETLSGKFFDQAADQISNSLFSVIQDTASQAAASGGSAGGTAGTVAGSVASAASSAASGEGKGGIGGFISGLFGRGKKAAAPGTTAANPLFVQDVGSITGTAANAQSESIANAVKEGLGGEGEGQKGFFGGLTEKLGGFFDGFKDKMGGLFDGLKGLFKGGGGGGGGGGFFGNILGSLFNPFGGGGGGGGLFSFLGFQNGGRVGSTDTVPAMLTPGEFVVRKEAVDKYGTSFLTSLNKGVLPMQGFQSGGSITPVTSEIGGNTSNSSVTNNSQFSFNIENGTAEQTGGEGQSPDQRQFAERVREAVTTVIHEESRMGGSLNYLRS